jgi:RNA polymerase sigma factor (sigma-70 family)
MLPAAAARSRSVMMAVVIGTAVTTAADPAQAAVAPPTDRAIEDINRYCTVCWRNARLPADRWGDCTQQVFTRLLERVEPAKWGNILAAEGDERKEFFRAIDAIKKRTQRDRKYAGLTPDAADRRADANLRDDREAVAAAAGRVLSDRQRRIVELTAGGWAVPEIAAELGTTAERVSDEKYKAIRKLRTHFGVE